MRALFNTCVHMSVCVRVRVSLSACVLLFSLFLSSSVVFEMIRGNSMSVCGCLDVRGRHRISPRGEIHDADGAKPLPVYF